MYVILRILKHMALVDFVTLPTYSLEQCEPQDFITETLVEGATIHHEHIS